MKLHRDFLATVSDRLYKLGEAVADPSGRNTGGYANRMELYNQFARHWELLGNVHAMFKGVQTNIARSMNAFKMRASIDPSLLKGADADAMFAGGRANIEKMAARIVATGGDNKALGRTVNGGFVRNFIGSVNEYWINSVLSGLKTQTVNLVTNMGSAVYMPGQRILAGALMADRSEMARGAIEYAALVGSIRDSLILAKNAFKLGDSILDPGRNPVEMRRAITSQAYGMQSGAAATAVNALGTAIRLPSRLLMTQDEFFKQLTYRSQVRAEAIQNAIKQHGLDWGKVSASADNAMDSAFDALGKGRDENALRNARAATFTDDLSAATWSGNKTFGQTVQEAMIRHPALATIAPFVRTPTNLLRFTWNHTPGLNLLRKQYLDDIRGVNGDEAAGRARAAMAVGGSLYFYAGHLAMSGDITGAGPADKDLQLALRSTRWQPYSFRLTNPDGSFTYHAYDRLDPVGMFFGFAANFVEIANMQQGRELEDIAGSIVVGTLRYFENKSYVSGIMRAMAALSDPERRGANFARNIVGGFVPNAFRQSINSDDTLRETRSLVDGIMSRLPYYSERLDPVRNLLGQPMLIHPGFGPDFISPIGTSEHPGTMAPVTPEWRATIQPRVEDEIARQLIIHNAAIRPPEPKRGQVDFTRFTSPETGKTAYDRWQQLTGEVEVNGQNLRQRLAELFRSDTYRNRATDGDWDYDGSRVDLIRQVVGAYRQKAEAQLRREIPDLDAALRLEARTQQLRRVAQ